MLHISKFLLVPLRTHINTGRAVYLCRTGNIKLGVRQFPRRLDGLMVGLESRFVFGGVQVLSADVNLAALCDGAGDLDGEVFFHLSRLHSAL